MALILLLGLSPASQAQSVTLSSPSSSSTNVDTVTALFSISEPAGTPQSIQGGFTCTSNSNTGLPGSIYTLPMKANTPAPGSFTVRPTDPANALNAYTASPASSMPEGTYSVYCQYVRPASAGGTTLKSTTRTNVLIDIGTLAPRLMRSYSTPVSVNTTTDVVTLANHGLPTTLPVTISGNSASSGTLYPASVIDANTFKLINTSSVTTYVDFTVNIR